MTNPVLAKSEAFSARPTYLPPQTGAQSANPYGAPGFNPYGPTANPYGPTTNPYAQQQGFTAPGQYPPSAAPGQPSWDQQSQTWQTPVAPVNQKVMTLDDVLTKTGLTLGLTIVVAVAAVWVTLTMNLSIPTLTGVGLVCGLATIIFPFIAAARRKVSPVIAIGFAILEGVFLGAISLIFEMAYPGIVLQAVLATFVAAGLTLAAFHFGKFRLSSKMRKIVMISVIAYAAVALLNLVLSFLGINLGMFPGPGQPVSWLAWLAAGIGVVLAVLSLVDDFQFVEQGIANRLPASESWRAAYGLTVTLVWLYVNLLRILSYIRR